MSRGAVAYAGARDTKLLDWNALSEIKGARSGSQLSDADADAWTSSMVSVLISYKILAATPASPISGPADVPAPEPIQKADLRDVYLKILFRSTMSCGDLHYAEMDLIQNAAFSLQAEEIGISLFYPPEIAADMLPAGPEPIRPPLKLWTTIGRGTMRNSVTPRRTLAAPVPNTGRSTPQRVPPWASTVFLENGLVAVPTAQIEFTAGINGPIVQSATIGKTPVSATDVPNGGLYFTLVGAEAASARAVFTLQL